VQSGSRRSSHVAPFFALACFVILGIAIVVLSRWVRAEYGRVVIGGDGGRPLIVDAALLGIGIGVLVSALVLGVSVVVVLARVARAERSGGHHDLVVPVERVGAWPRELSEKMAHSAFVGASDPYYCVVAVRGDHVELWADHPEPLLVLPASSIQQASIVREPWPSLRRVLNLRIEGFDLPIALSVMSQRWLIAPESSKVRLEELVGEIVAITSEGV
jgi:hypothetical protein